MLSKKVLRSSQKSGKEWKEALKKSEVRIQWDPEHNPYGNRMERKAIQLGLSGDTLKQYGKKSILKIEDITPMVKREKQNRGDFEKLQVPDEKIYHPKSEKVCHYLDIDRV